MVGRNWCVRFWWQLRSKVLVIKLADWRFRVDLEATRTQTTKNASDHCECAYCNNYYEAVDVAHPKLRPFLAEFGIHLSGPSELMPFEPTLMMACYRVQGEIQQWGQTELFVSGVPIVPEAADKESFLLWVGELELPWIQNEPVENVVSPANLPEFLERMREVWLFRHGNEFVFS